MTGVEPVTSSLPRKRSTTELHRHKPASPAKLSLSRIKERETRLELATLSLEGWCSTNWATPAFNLIVGREGFEPSKLSQQIYSLPHLAALEPPQQGAGEGIRTPDMLITNQLLWPTELHRQNRLVKNDPLSAQNLPRKRSANVEKKCLWKRGL